MGSDELLVGLRLQADRFAQGMAEVSEAFGEFAAALAMTRLDTAEAYVASLPRRHYADPCISGEEVPSDADVPV